MRYALLITFLIFSQDSFGQLQIQKRNRTTTDSELVLINDISSSENPPFSQDNSGNSYQKITDENLSFQYQKNIPDSAFTFSKLIFHTSTCFGNCLVIHLEISDDRTVKFSGNYFKDENFYEIDSARSGNFTGQLSEEIYYELVELIIQSNLPTMNETAGNILCCDGAIKTIILYHNGARKYYKAMFESKLMKELISYLYTFPEKLDLTEVDENFRFEQ